MNQLIAEILNRSSKNGHFDREQFRREQCATDPADRFTYRQSRELVDAYFGVSIPPEVETGYYFWDTTTLSMVDPIFELSANRRKFLEIGCGPSATLSVCLGIHNPGLKITCSDINPAFINSAMLVAQHNGVEIGFIESDMADRLKDQKFDMVFMNPPYLPGSSTENMGIAQWDAEFGCGDGGDDGLVVIRKFLDQVLALLAESGVALLGINTRHLADAVVVSEIKRHGFRTLKRYYDLESAQPNGPCAQVYLLTA